MNKSAITLSLLSISLLAQSTVVELSPISVTATGVEESVLEQPLSIATKGEKEIKLDQVIFQKDVLNSLAGVRIEQTGSVIGHMTSIRMPVNTSSYYLFMQDGIPVQSSGFFNHNGLAYTTFQSSSSVEVLKGAGTALYGSDAVAATINVQSLKKPSKEQEVIFKAMGGSDGYASGGLEMSDTIDEKSGYRASVNYMHSDGWRDHTETDRLEMNMRYDKTIDDENDIKVMFSASKTDAEQADSFNNEDNIENGSTASSDDPNYFTALTKTDVRRKFDYARLSLEWNNYSFNDLEITLTPYIRYNRNRYVATWEGNLPSNDNELVSIGFLEKNTYDTSWGKIITGVDVEYTESTLKYNQDFDTTVSVWSKPDNNFTAGSIYDYDVENMSVSPYIHTEYKMTDSVKLTAGLRYDYNRFNYTNNLTDGNVSLSTTPTYYRPTDKADSFSHLSPKLSLSFSPQKDINIYARYANGFNIPQASLLYSMKAGYQEVTLDPETTDTFEIGVKKLFGEKSYVELAVYYMTIDDTITRYTDGGEYYYDNGGSTIHQGIEATVQLQLTDELSSHIAYSYSGHDYDDDPKYGDREMAKAPNHLANTRIVYSPTSIHGLSLMGEWQYVGTSLMDDDRKGGVYGGYSIGNVKADYVYDKNIRLFAKVNNITDERYAVSASYAYGKADYTPGDPRQLYAGFEYRW